MAKCGDDSLNMRLFPTFQDDSMKTTRLGIEIKAGASSVNRVLLTIYERKDTTIDAGSRLGPNLDSR